MMLDQIFTMRLREAAASVHQTGVISRHSVFLYDYFFLKHWTNTWSKRSSMLKYKLNTLKGIGRLIFRHLYDINDTVLSGSIFQCAL